ncbi:MAG: ABC transporter substrate-binding protein [Armatimonadetes bacterium]|nr:ABC transporter substrate-binding protein [Armatimonadota bacterium]
MKVNQGLFTSVAGLAFASVLLTGCGPKAEPAPTDSGSTPTGTTTPTTTSSRKAVTAAGVEAGDTIKIGVVASLTGDQKPWGDDSMNGAKLALKEFNDAGGINGKKAEILAGDSSSKAETAKTAAEKLLSDGAMALVGEVSSGATIQMAKVAFDKAVPVVAVGATRTDLTDEGNHVFRVCYTDDFQGPLMAKFAYSDLGLRNVAVMTDNKLPYSQFLSKKFSEKFIALGGKIVTEAFYESGQTQFSSQLTDIKSKTPDGMFLSGYFTEVGPIAQQAAQAGLKVPMMGGDGWDSSQLLTSGGDAIIGSYFCNHYNNKESRPEVKNFLDKWKAAYGSEPGTTMGALGYDAMALTLDALKRSAKLNSKDLIAAIDATENFKGVSGNITLKGAEGNPKKRALVVEVRPLAEGFQVFKKAYEPDDLK